LCNKFLSLVVTIDHYSALKELHSVSNGEP